MVGVIWTTDDTRDVSPAVVLAIFSIEVVGSHGAGCEFLFLIGYLSPDDDKSGFPIWRPCRQRNGTGPYFWSLDLVYAESITGIAQIVRDPAIPASTRYSLTDSFFGLPTVFGAFAFTTEMLLLKKMGTDTRGSSKSKLKKASKKKKKKKGHEDDDDEEEGDDDSS